MVHSVSHKTVVIKKTIRAALPKVYAAFASAKARAKWAVPKGDVIKYTRANFKVGGRDEFKCGSPNRLEFGGIVEYHEILKNRRIIYTEIVTHSKKKISVSLITTELTEINDSTCITITAQLCSLDGNDMLSGYKSGWNMTLKNLTEFLTK